MGVNNHKKTMENIRNGQENEGRDGFVNDKYFSLYNLPYDEFIFQLINLESDILNSSIQVVTTFIGKHGNLEDIIGITGMLDKMSKDKNIVALNINTGEIRRRVDFIFTEKIKELIERAYIIDADVPSEITEAAFF